MIEMIKGLLLDNPKPSIVILAFLVTLAMTLVTKYFTDQKRMRELKGNQKACQIKMKEFQIGTPDYMAVQKELMACSMELFKKSFKPLMISFIPLILFFWWIRGIYSTVLPGWLWWYIPAGIVSSILLRKILKVV